ncbi:DUF2326 domain-containing protein [Methylotetracoccus oryzae]|uniref:DUF2326 domain-containing protein n=1 Tax=Methylotetracoccus oryzae TaxID=1919059 RepID=UPI0011194DDF|nr:DUF2326 domain-containing protein [Methylotetracoccus oryzae]
MLKLIHCEKFRESPVRVSAGFNVVSGDDLATNSIGKSTFLMLVDFAMGGETFLTHNSDVVNELGHHSYFFQFQFDGVDHFFRRDTDKGDLVFVCDHEWKIGRTLNIKEYCDLLRQYYRISDLGLSFRTVASLFTRVWGKENLVTDRPLDIHRKQRAEDALIFVLKLFDKYHELVVLDGELKRVDSEKTALRRAFRENIVPRIGKAQFKKNKLLSQQTTDELEDIKANLARYATNIREITNREVSDIKEQKDLLLKAMAAVDGRLRRLQTSLVDSKHVKSRWFEALKEFFPDVAADRIALVEEFHSDIAKILKREILATEKRLVGESDRINAELRGLDDRLNMLLKNVENPTIIVDRVFELSNLKGIAERENEYYEKEMALNTRVKELRSDLEEMKKIELSVISSEINDVLRSYAERIYGEGRKSPYLSFSKTNYKYEIFEDTGTGKAFANLIFFDWAIFALCPVPFLIHDSLLFKNVENEAVARMMEIYATLGRQTFIAIDEIKKYGEIAEQLIRRHTIVQLSNDAVLYVKDWRK